MYIAAGGPGLKQSGLAAFWFGEALVRPCLEKVGVWSGREEMFGFGRDVVRW